MDASAVFDLSVDYFIGMPSWVEAGDPKYAIYMTHTPQGSVHDGLSGAGPAIHEKYSYCGDAVEMYTHCGTHIDTLTHLGHFGCFWNGWTPEEHLGSRHWMKGGAEKHPPPIGRGVLLDVAGLHGVDVVPDVYAPSSAAHGSRASRSRRRDSPLFCRPVVDQFARHAG
jgi:hypothetical protein